GEFTVSWLADYGMAESTKAMRESILNRDTPAGIPESQARRNSVNLPSAGWRITVWPRAPRPCARAF
ncbi:hypothetical protein, partial [Aquitalea magnusonii]|uniref:hypothetical protein n=1 Tax=Aquitalea magnusonii TaxID=332411 RepID=UPI0019565991